MKPIKWLINNLGRQLFPEWCLGCGYPGFRVCSRCVATKLHYHVVPECHVCRLPTHASFVHLECSQSTYLDGVWTSCAYEELAHEMVHALKYRFNYGMAEEMARIMAHTILPWGILDGAVLSFVPTTMRRQRWRGFNQAQLLAEQIGKPRQLAVQELLLRRGSRHTQVGMNRDERQQNLHGSIGLAAGVLFPLPARVVIVDDVMTTGSTLEVCAKVLKQAGVREVYGLVFARG